MITFINTKDDKSCIKKIKKLYKEAFPRNEQVPFFILQYKAKSTYSDLFAVYDDGTYIAMICTVYYENIVFIWYLAVIDSERGNGYGTLILAKIAQSYKDAKIILNIEEVQEHANNNQQRKRKMFYLKNGYCECGLKTKEKDVIYEMLCYKDTITYDEYAKLMKNYMGDVFFTKLYREVIE